MDPEENASGGLEGVFGRTGILILVFGTAQEHSCAKSCCMASLRYDNVP